MSADPPVRRLGVIVGVCVLVCMLEGYDTQAFGVAAPHLAPELRLNPGQVGWAGSAANFGLVLGALMGGWAADRWGRKPVLLASVIAFGAFSLATAAAHGFDLLLASRFLTGLGFGGVMANLISVAAEGGMPAGGAAVSLLARMAGETADWRLLFVIGGALPLAIAPLVAWLLPETRPQPEPHLDRSLARALFGGGRLAPTLLLWAASLLTGLMLHLLLNWLPLLVGAKGHPAADGAAAALAFNVLGAVGSVAVGAAADRAGARGTALVAYAALAASLWALGASSGLAPILAAAAAAGFLLIGAMYVLYGLAPPLYPAQVRAAAAGVSVGAGRVGSILGPIVAGSLRQTGMSADHVLQLLAPVALAAGLCAVALTSLRRQEA
jgi:AAHS family 3-hydroxyphenylpropionic acid transporter